MHRPSIIFAVALVVTIAGVSAEYIWTGTEWKWKNPESPGASSDSSGTETGILDSTSEGSGDGDTWDDEDSYDNYDDYDEEIEVSKQNNNKYDFEDYSRNTKKDKKQKEKKNRNKNRDSHFYPSNSNSAILPATDDEDLFAGSGDDDDYDDYIPSTYNNPTTESPRNTNTNPIDYEDDDYDEDDYGEYENYEYEEDDDITFNPSTPIDINNIYNPTPSTTTRSFTTKRPTAPTTSRPEAGPGRGAHNPIPVNRPASFFAQPGILAAVIGGAVVGLLCAILLVMFIVYRMRKKDEGSYALDDSKRSHNVNSYSKPPNREFYA